MNNNEVKTLWLIPARGGSKGIPGKNIKPFCGRSPVARAIDSAKESAESSDTIFVSTDSKEIKEEAEANGISIPFLRPESLSDDNSSTYDVILHVLEEFSSRGREFQRVVLLQPTSPLRTSEDILNALKLWTPDIDMVVSVCEARTNPYFNAFETDDNGFLKISKGEGKIKRRQDAPKVWEYNGAVYVISVPSLLKEPISAFKKIIPSEMPPERSVDLDTPLDWIIAEHLYQLKNNSRKAK